MSMRWPAETVWEQVVPLLPGFTVEVLPEIDSSNTELMRRARAGQVEPTLLVAEHQSAGRGRMGRDWLGSPGATLTFSLGMLLAPQDWSGLSLAVGLSVAQSLDARLQIKWPNDLWLDGRKLCGILIETASVGGSRYAVIGIGINILPRSAEGLRTAPAALVECLPGIDAPAALQRVVLPLVQAIQTFCANGFAPLRDAYAARCALRGQTVVCTDGTTGFCQSVDASGALLVHTSAGVKKISSAEVSVRPDSAAP